MQSATVAPVENNYKKLANGSLSDKNLSVIPITLAPTGTL